jgi:hypothetical protein
MLRKRVILGQSNVACWQCAIAAWRAPGRCRKKKLFKLQSTEEPGCQAGPKSIWLGMVARGV